MMNDEWMDLDRSSQYVREPTDVGGQRNDDVETRRGSQQSKDGENSGARIRSSHWLLQRGRLAFLGDFSRAEIFARVAGL
jgi:SRSO17 transposase